jgi:fumarate hydratase class II
MPGKVNPVIPEAVLQVAAQVIGNDATITFCGQAGNFELNVMLPLLAYNLLQSIDLMSTAAKIFSRKCIEGISANADKCASTIEQSLALVTVLVPSIGYDKAAAIAKEAYESGMTIREVALKNNVLPREKLEELLEKAKSATS